MAESTRSRDQAAPRTNRGIDRLQVATAAIVVAFLLGAALTYFLVWPRDQSPDAIRLDTRLVFPGWEDLVIGQEPPADARQRCERVGEDRIGEGKKYEDCHSCRSASLPLPCVRVGIEDGVVWLVSAEIPTGKDHIAGVLAAIHAAWGRPTKQHRGVLSDIDCWYREHDQAADSVFKYDLHGVMSDVIDGKKDWNARVPRAQHPHRGIMIQARDVGDYCAEADEAEWKSCVEENCEAAVSAIAECQRTAADGADLHEWCREEWATSKRCSRRHCAQFESEHLRAGGD